MSRYNYKEQNNRNISLVKQQNIYHSLKLIIILLLLYCFIKNNIDSNEAQHLTILRLSRIRCTKLHDVTL